MLAWSLTASLLVLSGCGRGHGAHLLPSGAGGHGAAGATKKPRTINEAAYPNAVISDSPIAFYRLDDSGSTMTDYGPNHLNGSYGSSVSKNIPSLVPNTIDPAARFPGGAWSANSIATVPQTSALQPTSVSVEGWIFEQGANSGGYVDVVSYGSQSGGQGYTLQITPSNTMAIWMKTTSGSAQAVGSTVLTPGTAYHVVGTYDGSNAKIYINGVLDGSSTGGAAISYSGIGTYGLSLGAGQSTSRSVFYGTLDDVSVFGSALSATQVAAHYAAAQSEPDDPYAQAVMADGPSAYWRLDDAGTTMYDATNNRVNGTYGSSITHRVTGLVPNTTDTAASFPGGTVSSTNTAIVPQNSSYLQPSSAITVEAWIKESVANSGQNVDLVSYGPQAGRAYALEINSANQLKWLVTTTGTSIGLIGSTTLTTGTTYHVVATYDGANAKIYVNGTQDVSVTGSGTIDYSSIGTYGLSIGGGQSTTRNVINGTVDEVAVYGKALNSSQVALHYTTSSYTASQSGPAHIATWSYYDGSLNYAVALSYMLRHVDWVEARGDYTYTSQFRGAGGAHAVAYVDPGISYYCNSPFGPTSQNTPGSCALPSGPLGDPTLSSDDTAWLHGTGSTSNTDASGYASPAGARLHHYQDSHFLWGEPFNPGSSHVRNAFASATSAITGSQTIDAFFMDDSSGHYSTDEYNYLFATTASEYDSLGSSADSQYNSDVVGELCYASRPVFFNGPSWNPLDTTNGPTEKADDTRMLQSPCTYGVSLEGEFVGSGRRHNLNQGSLGGTFIPVADQALLAQSLNKFALSLNYTGCTYGSTGCTYDPVGDRMYALGGIWLVYDPRFTIAWNGIDTENGDPGMIDTDGNPDSMVQEFNIVPTQPYQTATGVDITTLQISDGHSGPSGSPAGGTFRREFAQCYQNGASIGRCAVVLNPESTQYTSGGVVSMPTLSHGPYAHALVLDNVPADAGGTATWTTTIPTSLQPATAVILAQ